MRIPIYRLERASLVANDLCDKKEEGNKTLGDDRMAEVCTPDIGVYNKQEACGEGKFFDVARLRRYITASLGH